MCPWINVNCGSAGTTCDTRRERAKSRRSSTIPGPTGYRRPLARTRRHFGEYGVQDATLALEDIAVLEISDVITRDKQMRAACEQLGMLVGP